MSRKTNWDRISSKGYTETAQGRDVYDTQQLERGELPKKQTFGWRWIVCIGGAVCAAVLTYCVWAGYASVTEHMAPPPGTAASSGQMSGTEGTAGGMDAEGASADGSADGMDHTDGTAGAGGTVSGSGSLSGEVSVGAAASAGTQDGSASDGTAGGTAPGDRAADMAPGGDGSAYGYSGGASGTTGYYVPDTDIHDIWGSTRNPGYSVSEPGGTLSGSVSDGTGADGTQTGEISDGSVGADGENGAPEGINNIWGSSGGSADAAAAAVDGSAGASSGTDGSAGAVGADGTEASGSSDINNIWGSSGGSAEAAAQTAAQTPAGESSLHMDLRPRSASHVFFSLLAGILTFALLYELMKKNLEAQNTMSDFTDINQYENDQHIALPEEIQRKFDWFPDVGAHSSVLVSSMISHMMLENKGIKTVKVAKRYEKDVLDEDGNVVFYKGEIVRDEDGEAVLTEAPMFDTKFADSLFEASGAPKEVRKSYDVRKIPYNADGKNREKLSYKMVPDLINGDWELPEYEPQRPAGAYIVDTAPVNTMV